MKKYEATYKRFYKDSNETGRFYLVTEEIEASSIHEALEKVEKTQRRIDTNVELGHIPAWMGREIVEVKEA